MLSAVIGLGFEYYHTSGWGRSWSSIPYFGGYKAVGVTQTAQMTVIFSGLFAAAYFLVERMPEGVGSGGILGFNGRL